MRSPGRILYFIGHVSLSLSLPVSLGGRQVLPVPRRERELHANGTVESCGRLP